MIQEEEAREQAKAKTTDSMNNPTQERGMIDTKPVVASKRIGFWEEALKKQKQ